VVTMGNRVVVIGIGNTYRHDDGLGPAVLDRLRRRTLPSTVELAESDGEPSALLDLWHDASLAILVDAAHTAAPAPGRIHRRSLRHPSIASLGSTSSHGIDLGDAIALGAALDRLPDTVLLYVVEAGDTSLGIGLSRAVETAADELADELAEELIRACSSPPHD
jgi:hydrogenase maturation protease